MRAGECLEPALCEVYKDALIGKILIQTNESTGEPEVTTVKEWFLKDYNSIKSHIYFKKLHYLRLPKDIKNSHIFLMDATLATGAAAMMAIRVLLDHSVAEENIILISLITAEQGI